MQGLNQVSRSRPRVRVQVWDPVGAGVSMFKLALSFDDMFIPLFL